MIFERKNNLYYIKKNRDTSPCGLYLGPNKHGLVTYIQVNVYIGNTLSWLNGD